MEEREVLKDDVDATDGKKRKPKRVASRFFNALLALVYFVLFAMCLVSFSAFSNNYVKVTGHNTYSNGQHGTCILNAQYDSSSVPAITLNNPGSCQLAIGGEVVIALYSILSIVVMVIKIIGGWSIISCFLFFELITAIVMTLLAFATSVVISAGLSLTCKNLEGSQTAASCNDYTVPAVNGIRFYTEIEVAQATGWLGFGILFVIDVFYSICVVMYCYGKRQAKLAKQKAYEKAIEEQHKEDELKQEEHDDIVH